MKMKNKKGIATIYIVIFTFVLLIFVGYAIWDNYQKAVKINSVNPSLIKPVTKTTTTTTNPTNIKITSTIYPNSNLTPGNLLTMDEYILCIPGNPEKIQMNKGVIPESVVKQVFANYQIKYPTTKAYQIDKFIPYSLGGSDNIKNLWPQSIDYPGYKEKDIAEKYLYNLMCNKTINITEAQLRIKTDWVKVYKEAQNKTKNET
jgi:hypothetical protein